MYHRNQTNEMDAFCFESGGLCFSKHKSFSAKAFKLSKTIAPHFFLTFLAIGILVILATVITFSYLGFIARKSKTSRNQPRKPMFKPKKSIWHFNFWLMIPCIFAITNETNAFVSPLAEFNPFKNIVQRKPSLTIQIFSEQPRSNAFGAPAETESNFTTAPMANASASRASFAPTVVCTSVGNVYQLSTLFALENTVPSCNF